MRQSPLKFGVGFATGVMVAKDECTHSHAIGSVCVCSSELGRIPVVARRQGSGVEVDETQGWKRLEQFKRFLEVRGIGDTGENNVPVLVNFRVDPQVTQFMQQFRLFGMRGIRVREPSKGPYSCR